MVGSRRARIDLEGERWVERHIGTRFGLVVERLVGVRIVVVEEL